MQAKVWNRSADTTALKKYFDQHASKYNSKTLSEVKGKVMNDYQDFLEKEWIDELRSQNFVKINQKVLKKLITFYRRKILKKTLFILSIFIFTSCEYLGLEKKDTTQRVPIATVYDQKLYKEDIENLLPKNINKKRQCCFGKKYHKQLGY